MKPIEIVKSTPVNKRPHRNIPVSGSLGHSYSANQLPQNVGAIDSLKKRKNSNSRLIISDSVEQMHPPANILMGQHLNVQQTSAVFGGYPPAVGNIQGLQSSSMNEIRPVMDQSLAVTLDSQDQAEVQKP